MADHDLKLICKRTVVSTKPVEPGKFIHLSVLDRKMERNHLRAVFYYQFPIVREAGELTKKLRESVSEMLSSFPVVLGRLLRCNPNEPWMIKCNDAGLRMVEAKANCTLSSWLQNVDREKELNLIHWEEMFDRSYFWSPFYVQITEFDVGGLAIGLSCTHMVSDPVSMTMMIKAWADTTLSGKIVIPPSFDPLPRRCPPHKTNQSHCHLIDHYKSIILRENAASVSSTTKQTTITFKFSHEMVENCISLFGISEERDPDPSLQPFVSLTALFWTRISKIKGSKGRSSLIDMAIGLDMRKVLGLDTGFFGNCMVYNRVKGNEELNDNEAINAVNKAVSEMDKNGVLDLVEWLEQEKSENIPWINGYHLICVNLENVIDLYSSVFEVDVSPIRVSYYIEPAVGLGQIMILPSPRGEGAFGRVVMVTLPEDEAEKLVEDAFIQQFAPSILMGSKGRKS